MSQVHDDILMITKASAITNIELIQPLWNNYGTLSRVSLRGGTRRSVIMKHIQLPERRGHLQSHPRGFGSARSRQRKITSYHVEMRWYDHYNARLPKSAPTPRCLGSFTEGDELCLILEDLAERGFDRVVERASRREIELVISWLASFHARFMRVEPEGLWSQGTYWHLDTRPDELAEIKGSRVHRFASFIDARLRRCEFQTLVHGDAKLANFCFSSDHASVDLDMSAGVAAVDFQYVGRGCGMSDLAYFLGSCLSEPECQALEEELLELYFAELRAQLTSDLSAELTVEETSCLTDLNRLDMDALEAKWRALYPAAWADFQRFLLGWSPSHHKLTTYSDTLTTATIDEIRDELLSAARSACLAAGELISSYQERVFTVSSKGFASAAGDVLTEVDIRAQELILEQLAPSIRAYDLGILAEEGEQDRSRLEKHAFWTIDPLDGTQQFVEGEPGFAVSIALVAQSGESLLGAVYDPVNQNLYQAVKGEGVTLNGDPLAAVSSDDDIGDEESEITWFADRSLRGHPQFERYQSLFDIRFVGGAVMNTLSLLTTPRSFYLKLPKEALGGGAIWDFAAVTLMLTEAQGSAQSYHGLPLSMNRVERIFFNDVGITCVSSDLSYAEISSMIHIDQAEPQEARLDQNES